MKFLDEVKNVIRQYLPDMIGAPINILENIGYEFVNRYLPNLWSFDEHSAIDYIGENVQECYSFYQNQRDDWEREFNPFSNPTEFLDEMFYYGIMGTIEDLTYGYMENVLNGDTIENEPISDDIVDYIIDGLDSMTAMYWAK